MLIDSQILERKNQEIEDVKSHYRAKVKEQDDCCAKLERKGRNDIQNLRYSEICLMFAEHWYKEVILGNLPLPMFFILTNLLESVYLHDGYWL